MKRNKLEYYKKLKDPRWQKKRLEILKRDDFACKICGDTESTLHIHHRKYSNGDPWDIDEQYLITLCENCHHSEQDCIQNAIRELSDAVRQKFFSSEIMDLAMAIKNMPMLHIPEVVMSALREVIESDDSQKMIIEYYFKLLKESENAGETNGKEIHGER